MSKRLSISVMAHPSREQYFGYLRDRLGDVPFAIDSGAGIIENCKNAWKLYDKRADYHIVVQDDAIVCQNFMDRALGVINRYNNRILLIPNTLAYNFYYNGQKALSKEASRGEKNGYIVTPLVRWGVAICLPTNKIEKMLRSFESKEDPQDDERISKFIREEDMRVVFPIPSLIDHRTCDSLIPWTPINNNRSKRVAYKFIDNN